MSSELIQVVTVTAEQADAQRIAALLLDRRLAACTQISGPLESSYWWNDRIETTREWQVTARTRRDLYAEVEAAIREIHPYDVPEILAISIGAVSPAYQAWVLGQIALPPKPVPEPPPAEEPAKTPKPRKPRSKKAPAAASEPPKPA